MSPEQLVEPNIATLARMSKQELKRQIRSFDGGFKLDFTEDYMEAASEESLRHILFAVLSNAHARH